jgi:signal transduction histidine kinase
MLDRHSATRTFTLFTSLPLRDGKLRRYLAALIAMTAALGLRSVFQPVLGGSMLYVSISAATMFAAWYCGLWPAVLSTIYGFLAANALFLPPYRILGPYTQRDVIGELLFLTFCGALIALGEGWRRAVLRLGCAHDALLRSRTQLKFRVRERTGQLQQSNQNLRELSARLLRVQDDERRRIARDLHDSTGQALTALKLELAGIQKELTPQNPKVALRLASSIEGARLISDELRTISYLLHPPLLDELGLGSALRWYVDGFEKRSGIKIRLQFSGDARLAPEMETTLFRVVQEALINIHRHSGSSTASIRVVQSADQIALEIEDEGMGIAADKLANIASGAPLGVGLRGMRERIKDVGGEMEILSSGRGTRVKAAIPIEPCAVKEIFAQATAGVQSSSAGSASTVTHNKAKPAGA